jgi:hypothetical protein
MRILQRETVQQELQGLGPTDAFLIIDSSRCPHSKRLLQELEVLESLSKQTSGDLVKVCNVSGQPLTNTWIPGVPLLLKSNGDVALGIDAMNAAKQMVDKGAGLKKET